MQNITSKKRERMEWQKNRFIILYIIKWLVIAFDLLSDCKITTYICTILIFTIKIRLQSRNKPEMNQKWETN